MGDIVPSPLPPSRPSFPMLYYGLIVVGTALSIIALYSLAVVRWCTRRDLQSQPRNIDRLFRWQGLESISIMRKQWGVSSFRYGQEGGVAAALEGGDCAVCLSAFEDGDDVWLLPRCGHYFHAPCIKMWLYSHSNCPLCRTPVVEPQPLIRKEDYPEGLLASDVS